jgi:hypothetical protein
MCALHDLRAQTHLGLSAVRCSGWFPPGAPPTAVLVPAMTDASDAIGDQDPTVSTPAARCDCLAGVLHAL